MGPSEFSRGNRRVCDGAGLGTLRPGLSTPLTELNERQQTVLEAIQMMGGLTPQQIKEETGLLNKEIMPALHRLQEAFVVYEDQVAANWNLVRVCR